MASGRGSPWLYLERGKLTGYNLVYKYGTRIDVPAGNQEPVAGHCLTGGCVPIEEGRVVVEESRSSRQVHR